MSCDRWTENLLNYSMDLLDRPAAAEIRAHLSSCSNCQTKLANLQATTALLVNGLEPTPPPTELKAKVLRRIRQKDLSQNEAFDPQAEFVGLSPLVEMKQQQDSRTEKSRYKLSRFSKIAALAACLCGLMLGYYAMLKGLGEGNRLDRQNDSLLTQLTDSWGNSTNTPQPNDPPLHLVSIAIKDEVRGSHENQVEGYLVFVPWSKQFHIEMNMSDALPDCQALKAQFLFADGATHTLGDLTSTNEKNFSGVFDSVGIVAVPKRLGLTEKRTNDSDVDIPPRTFEIEL